MQIHGAHGYLLNKFLSPAYNKRTDKYGGDLNGRMQIVLDILAEIKTTCGDNFHDEGLFFRVCLEDYGGERSLDRIFHVSGYKLATTLESSSRLKGLANKATKP